jgi:cytochrome c oxidase subunit 2
MMSKHMKAAIRALALVWGAALAPAAHAAWTLNMTQGVTEISRRVYGLHMIIFYVCCVIAVFVFGWMIYSIVVFRKSRGAVADTKMVHNTTAEFIWTVIPVLILIGSAVPAARTLMETEDASNTEMTIIATGYQWRWGYRYLESGVQFFSALDHASNEARQLQSGIDPNSVEHYLLNVDRPLVVPAGTKIRMLLTAQDVIHAWWVPALAVKKDAIPGFTNEIWFKIDTDKVGLYRGQCAELCGRDHGFMPIVVDVRSKADFAKWLAEQKAAAAAESAAAAPDAAATAPAAATTAG